MEELENTPKTSRKANFASSVYSIPTCPKEIGLP